MQHSESLSVSVIVPAYNAAITLAQCLAPLLRMRAAGAITEIIVVDDGSTDATATIAREAGVSVIPSGGRLGPGGARNIAARAAGGAVLWFVDADAVVHDDAAQVLRQVLADGGVSAVFGAYDDRPAASDFWSQYKNLVHHHYHRRSNREAETFWAGCGAIRTAAFHELGGFDAEGYPQPSIEDIELGWRMRQRGFRIVLVPELQATHLKIWRLPNLLHTEIFSRALPWSRLIHARTGWVNELNVSRGERFRALIGVLFLASLPLTQVPLWLSMTTLALAFVLNRDLLDLFHRRRGPIFAAAATLFHQVYYAYCAGAAVWAWHEHRWSTLLAAVNKRRSVAPAATAEAFADGRRCPLLAAADE